ncbi:hypothetical protein VOLCADRAFT_84296 [Volvox carteri f. nagariensis]|uniref:isopentenyl-diphosphate Delta-isomerase n=1 Tax=Volvox carteri f. nagariensis TaxID=3068 RepID=D8UHB3_VOLCA|nr:uncharacterized protein VOLCADRAFT_84296 [Volvox carteri f. nagariensis]EFJ40900.1 hypothetical protein VOLCADRAFT_84296 [Volvox carteri f. nagariensis]|eukprot:XP_002958060.1 hypothetical protein VOLCADRAFT_84296 [Volvox carteri f. nagariensis]
MQVQRRTHYTNDSRCSCSMPSAVTVPKHVAARLVNLLSQPAHLSSAARAQMAASSWAGTGMTQQDFMHRDECLVVDQSDTIVGTSNKHDCHRFTPAQPRGLLHRAFSVFLFSPDGKKLLLQQRAASKVTFPSVWTNTCCSHPLAGQEPNEVDAPEKIADGSVPGVKAAALRKLAHELGIPPEQVPPASFTFLTRLHYCASDTHTYGPAAEWGEHEIDYILFVRPTQPVTLAPNPDEVDDVRYVDRGELAAMMDPKSGLRWSPWFRILAERFLDAWWQDLDATLDPESKHRDYGTIHHIL